MKKGNEGWDIRCPDELKELFPKRSGYYYRVGHDIAKKVLIILSAAYHIPAPKLDNIPKGSSDYAMYDYDTQTVLLDNRNHLKSVFHEFYHHLDNMTGGEYDSADNAGSSSSLSWIFAEKLWNTFTNKEKKPSQKRVFGRLMILLLLFIFISLQAEEPKIVFQVNPGKVQLGDPVTLSWDAPGADAVFLTNIGRVEIKGQLEVYPKEKLTSYFLIVGSKFGLKVKAEEVKIEVIGGRGIFPQKEAFIHSWTYCLTAPSLVELLDCCHYVLQNAMRFEVDERYDRKKTTTVFVTGSSIQPDMVEKTEIHIRSRRISYWVEIRDNKSPQGKFTCEIRTFVEYQLRMENTWRPETSDSHYLQGAEKLYNLLAQHISPGR